MITRKCTLVLSVVLLFSCGTCSATVINSGQQYFLQAGSRGGCAGDAYIGYLNKTCSTAGPVLRAVSDGNTWRMFILKKVGKTSFNEDLVEIQTYYSKSSSKKPRCQGYVVPEKKDACSVATEPLAGKVGINANRGDAWALSPVTGKKDTYTIHAYSRKSGCLKYLAAAVKCSEKYLQLDAKDDRSGRQHWQITLAKASPPPPPRRDSPPPPLEFVTIPAVNYTIALTGYNSSSFGPPEKTEFCNSIFNSTAYRQDWVRCNVTFVTDVPSNIKLFGRRLTQASTAYVRGYTAFEFIIGNVTSQQQAQNAAEGLYQNISSPYTLQTIFQPSFPNSTIAPDLVNLGEIPVSLNSLPTDSSASPTPTPTPTSPSPSPALSPEFNTVPGGDGVITDPPVTSPIPNPSTSPIPNPSSPSSPLVTLPGVPMNVLITVNTGAIGTVIAAWTAPSSNGGAIVTYGILCTANTGGSDVSAAGISSTSYVVTGLTPGGTYSCSVQSTNISGSSAYSTAVTGIIIAPVVPSAPISVVFSANSGTGGAGDGTWSFPNNNGGATIISYDIECNNVNNIIDIVSISQISAGLVCSISGCGSVVYGMTGSETYTCKIRATNSVGSSSWSNPSNTFTVSTTVPGVPTNPVFTAADSSANAAWTVPPSNGGRLINTYGIYCTANTGPDVPATVDASVCTISACNTVVTGLASGTAYTCTVLATNSVGSSAPSAPSGSFTPSCFPRMATVQLRDGTKKFMYQLVPGDQVLSVDHLGQITYSPIYILPHAVPHGMYGYRKFTMAAIDFNNNTSPSYHVLIASPDHYLLLAPPSSDAKTCSPHVSWSSRRAITAAEANVGDHMWVVNNEKNQVTSTTILAIEDILDEGMYAPFTLTGTIVVDSVAASVYTNMMGSEYFMHVWCARARFLYRIWPQFFTFIHQRNWASPFAINIAYAVRAVLKMLSVI